MTSPSGIFESSRRGARSCAQLLQQRNIPRTANGRAARVMTASPMFWGSAVDRQHRQIVKSSNGIGFRPQPNAACRKAGVTMIDEWLVVQPALNTISIGRNAELVPLTECGRFHVGAGDHAAAAVVVVEPKIVFQRVSAHEVIAAFGEAKNNACRCVLLAGNRLEADRNRDVAVRTTWCHNNIVLVVGRALHQGPPPLGGAGDLLR